MPPFRSTFLALAAMTVAAPALAQQGPPQAPAMMNTASPADKALVEAMDKMGGVTAKPLSGNTDQDFASLMLAHHQSALDMAKVELRYGKDPFLQGLARQIIASQSAEIRKMKAWQAKHPVGQ